MSAGALPPINTADQPARGLQLHPELSQLPHQLPQTDPPHLQLGLLQQSHPLQGSRSGLTHSAQGSHRDEELQRQLRGREEQHGGRVRQCGSGQQQRADRIEQLVLHLRLLHAHGQIRLGHPCDRQLQDNPVKGQTNNVEPKTGNKHHKHFLVLEAKEKERGNIILLQMITTYILYQIYPSKATKHQY